MTTVAVVLKDFTVSDIKSDSLEAKEHPLICAFVDLRERSMADGLLNFDDLQMQPFMKFWKNFCITRLVNADKDYEIILWGTDLTQNYGKDLTGALAKCTVQESAFEILLTHHYKTIKDKQVSYISGTLGWENKSYVKWHQIFVPLLKNNKICCLSVICFS